MPVDFCQTHTLAGHPTSFSVSRGRICRLITDGFVVDTEMPGHSLTPDERLTISRDLTDIVVGWIRNGFTPERPLSNYLRLHIYGFPSLQQLDYVCDYLCREIEPLQDVFKFQSHIDEWVSEVDGSRKIDLMIEIALTEDVGVYMLIR